MSTDLETRLRNYGAVLDRTTVDDGAVATPPSPVVLLTPDDEAAPSKRFRAIVFAAAAVALTAVGLAAVARERHVAVTAAVPTAASPPPEQLSDPTTTLASAPGLLSPGPSDTFLQGQFIAALPRRTQAAVLAPDNSVLAVSTSENFFGAAPDGREQQTHNGFTVSFGLEDSNRSYIALKDCVMFGVSDGDHAEHWRPEVLSLFDNATVTTNAEVSLPTGWSLLRLGPDTDLYITQFATTVGNIRTGIAVQQMQGTTAGPFLAAYAGRAIEATTFRGDPAWVVTAPDSNRVVVIWEHGGDAYQIEVFTLLEGQVATLNVEQLAAVVDTMVERTVSDWRSVNPREPVITTMQESATTAACPIPKLKIRPANG